MKAQSKRRIGLAALVLFIACEERVVEPADVARVELTPEVLTLRVGGTSQFQATVFDSQGNALTGRDVAWSIEDEGVGAVAENGTVIGTSIGETRVIARAGGQQGSATLRVTSNTVASVEVVPAEAALEFGGTRAFDAVVRATDGTTLTDRNASWSSAAASVAIVNDQGVVTGVGLGSTTILAAVDGIEGEASVAIVAPTLTSLEVQPAAVSLQVGGQQQLTAVGRKDDGAAVPGLPVAWRSLDPDIATVDAAGLVTATGEGVVRIEAGFGRFIGASTVTVSPIPAASIDVQPEAPAILVNDTARLTATVRSADGTVLGRTPNWSSSQPAVATVDGGGLVRGVASGFTYIVAALDGVRDSALVRVAARPIAAVVVLPSESVLQVGETVQLTAQVISDDGSQQTREVSWESANPAIATVSGSGLVTARATGVAVIRATAGGVTGTAVINVNPPPIASLEVRPATVELEPGGTATLTAVGRTAGGEEVPGLGVAWRSSNTAVATVSSGGTVTAVAPGTAQITATAQGIEASASVTVTNPGPASIDISGGNFSLTVGETRQLSATVRNAAGDVVSATVSWSSKAAAIASVSGSGLVSAQGAGSTWIVASVNALRDSVAVTVTSNDPASIDISGGNFSLEAGEEQALSATVRNAAGTTLDVAVAWSSKNGAVASVDGDGLVQGVAPGTTYIVASAGAVRDSVQVTVTEVAVALVVVTPLTVTLEEDETVRLTARVYDVRGNELERTVVWSTNQNNIVNVAQNGRVTAKREGVAIVTATAGGKSGSSTITVVDDDTSELL